MLPRSIEPLCLVVLLSGCLFGGSGAPDRVLTVLPELICLPLFFCTAAVWVYSKPPSWTPHWIAAAILGFAALQLIPLPPAVWSLLPGRADVAQSYSVAGIVPSWLPISLTPAATLRILLGLLPAVSLFLAIPCLTTAARRRLMHVAIGLGVLDVFLGFGQLVGGEDGPLLFYGNASFADAAGFFANRNHNALFLAILILFVGALFSGGARLIEKLWLAAAGAILIIGVAASGSRAGLALGAGACLCTAWIVLTSRNKTFKPRAIVVWSFLAIVPIAIGVVLFGTVMWRFQLGALSGDLRWQIARTTWHAIWQVFPVGGGFGSFESVYARLERPDELISAIINNAHDDWLEVALEGGLPALLLSLAALAYLIRETAFPRAWSDRSSFSRAVRSATLAILWLCALHSIVDYPLRTMAVNVLAALACGLRAALSMRSAEAPATGMRDTNGRRSTAPRTQMAPRRPARSSPA